MNHLRYDGGTGNLKNWLIQEGSSDSKFLEKCEAIFVQGNGYTGVKDALEESYPGEARNTFAAGTFNKASAERVIELPNVPDMTGMTVLVGGYVFNLIQGKLSACTRTMNLKNRETVREVRWKSPGGIYTVAVFKRIVPLVNEHMIVAALGLMVDKGVQIVTETGTDGTMTNSDVQHFKDLRGKVCDGRNIQHSSRTMKSDVWVAQHAACSLNLQTDILPAMERHTLKNCYIFMAKAGQSIHFKKISTIHTSRDLEYENAKAEDIEEKLMANGLKSLRESNPKGYQGLKEVSALQWEKYWRESGITIDGDTNSEQLAVCFSLYHLNITTEQDDNWIGIGAKALTGEGYKGHSLWDTELFTLPYFVFIRPGAAKSLLEHRCKNLVGVRRKAKENGYEGTICPWGYAWVGDGKITPLYKGADIVTGKIKKMLAGLIEHRVSADIVYAIWQYYLMTGDRDFTETRDYEMILDTASFWVSWAQYRKGTGRHETLDVIGPDEYKEHVNNNTYTNYMADYSMHLALFIMESLLDGNTGLSKRLDRKLNLSYIKEKVDSYIDEPYLPGSDEDSIIPQTDRYLHSTKIDITKYENSEEAEIIYKDFNARQISGFTVSGQIDTVMPIFLFPNLFDEEAKQKNFIFYEDKILHDSSSSKYIHSIMANDLRFTEMAYDFYKRSFMIGLGPQTKSSNEGIHSVAIGGIWESTVMGFDGVRLKGEYLHTAPKLPKEWKKLIFPLCLKGCRLEIAAAHQELAVEDMGQQESSCILSEELVSIEPGAVKKIEL